MMALMAHVQVSMMATTREFLVMARHNLIPGWLAEVHPKLGTPYRVIIAYGCIKGKTAVHCRSTLFLTVRLQLHACKKNI